MPSKSTVTPKNKEWFEEQHQYIMTQCPSCTRSITCKRDNENAGRYRGICRRCGHKVEIKRQ